MKRGSAETRLLAKSVPCSQLSPGESPLPKTLDSGERSPMSSPAIARALRAGTAGEHPVTYTAGATPGAALVPPVQPVRIKTPAPSPDAGFAAGGEGGRGAYVHTDRNIARETYEGTTEEGIESERNRLRYKDIAAISWALQQSEDDREKQAGLRLLGCDGLACQRG